MIGKPIIFTGYKCRQKVRRESSAKEAYNCIKRYGRRDTSDVVRLRNFSDVWWVRRLAKAKIQARLKQVNRN